MRGGGAAEGDRQLLLAEMKRLREQYEDLIKQMEQTQAIIDKQQVSHRVEGGMGRGGGLLRETGSYYLLR